jgi:hypothetical protein
MKKKETNSTELRKTMKGLVNRELEILPDLIENLPPKQRIEVILKLLPFVVPKVESISHTSGEPFEMPY